MDVTQPTDDEQSKHWNTTAGCAWVDAQDLLDQTMKGLEDLLVDGVAAGSGRREGLRVDDVIIARPSGPD